MIKCFTFENFKSFEKAELNIEPFTSVVGTNSSGKSNAVEGIKILSECASGVELKLILDGTPSFGSRIRGGSKSCPRFKTRSFKLGCLISRDDTQDLLYEIRIGVNGNIWVEEEGLYLVPAGKTSPKTKKVFKTKKPEPGDSDIKVEFENDCLNGALDLLCARNSAILPQLIARAPKDKLSSDSLEDMQNVLNSLKSVMVLNPDTRAMREYCRIEETELRDDCSNLSAVLYHLCQDEIVKSKLLGIISALPENEIVDISFVKTKIGDVIFGLKERYINSKELVDARQLSDGTLRCLAMISAIMSGDYSGLIIFEEADNGIHPGRILKLITSLYELGRERNIDVMITTHNGMLMNQYKTPFLNGVSVVYREKEKGTSQFVALPDVDAVPEIFAAGGLGDAMIDDRLIDRIKNGRRKANCSWLEV